MPSLPQSHNVSASLADPDWTDPIPSDRPTMLVADGLFAFLTEPVIVGIFGRSPNTSVRGNWHSTTTAASAG